jgi:hypothetical protein
MPIINPEVDGTQAVDLSEDYFLVAPGDRFNESDVLEWAGRKYGGVVIYDRWPECLGQNGPAAFDALAINVFVGWANHLIISPESGCPAISSWHRRINAGEKTVLIATTKEWCGAWAWRVVRHYAKGKTISSAWLHNYPGSD